MNRFISILWGILVFLISFMPYETMAQNTNKTSYQQSKKQFENEFAKKLGYSEYNNEAQIAGFMALVQGMQDYSDGKNTKFSKIYLWHEEQTKALEKKRVSEAEYEDTDYYRIKESIKRNFEKWNKKGEFENTTSYEERLKTQSVSKFYELCTSEITDYYKSKYRISGELQTYNADEQYYPVTISYDTHQYSRYHFERKKYTSKLYIPIDDALEFKKNFYEHLKKWEGEISDFVFVDDCLALPKLTLKKYVYDVDSGEYLLYDKYECIVPIDNSRNVEFSFKDLNIQNPYCADAVWNIDMIRLADSIACIKYNHEIDSLVTAYNQDLLQNKYNFGKETIKTVKVECGPGIETRYNTAKNNIIDKYNSIIAIAEAAKQREQDSIACIDYNKQLDSIAESYNQKLLEEEYNFDKKTIKFLPLDLNSGKKGQEIKDWFNKEKKNINEKYNSIIADANNNKKIIEDYKQTNFTELKSFKFVNYNYHDMYNNCPGYLTRNIANPSAYNSRYSNALVEKLMEVTVDINTQLNNEWTKNGQYFENKVDFFNSFVKFWPYNVVSINPDYKTILKEKKKANK